MPRECDRGCSATLFEQRRNAAKIPAARRFGRYISRINQVPGTVAWVRPLAPPHPQEYSLAPIAMGCSPERPFMPFPPT